MEQFNSLKTFLKNERNQRMVNRLFIFGVVVFVLVGLFRKGWQVLPELPLYFITSDAFELTFTCSLALLIYYVILPQDSIRKKVAGIVLCLFIITIFAYLKDYRRGRMFLSMWSEFSSFVGMTFIFTSLFYIFDNLNLLINNSLIQTQKALHQAKNQLLRQQLNPHFLFNAFNSLYSMSLSNNPKTAESILRMSGMMRYITDEMKVERTPLKKELKFIEDYVKIEQLRFGDQADIQFIVDGNVEDAFIEPLLLISLVENAFKHGFYTNDPSAFVHIYVTVSEAFMHFRVANKIVEKQHFQENGRNGKGLELLRNRLALAYGKRANLLIRKEEDQFIAELKIGRE